MVSEEPGGAEGPHSDRANSSGTSSFFSVLVLRTAAFSAIVLFVNAVARQAFFQILAPGLATEHLSFFRLPFFDVFMALYGVFLCMLVVSLPGRMAQRAVNILDLSSWRHPSVAFCRLCSAAVILFSLLGVGRWIVDRWLSVRLYLESAPAAADLTLRTLLREAMSKPGMSIDYMSRISYVFASSIFIGLIALLVTRYYSFKRRPFIEWTRFQRPFFYWATQIFLPVGLVLTLYLLLLQVPIAYGSALANHVITEHTRNYQQHQPVLVLKSESAVLAPWRIVSTPALHCVSANFCYGDLPAANRFLIMALETDDSYVVSGVHGVQVQTTVTIAKSSVMEVGY